MNAALKLSTFCVASFSLVACGTHQRPELKAQQFLVEHFAAKVVSCSEVGPRTSGLRIVKCSVSHVSRSLADSLRSEGPPRFLEPKPVAVCVVIPSSGPEILGFGFPNDPDATSAEPCGTPSGN